MRCQQNYTTNGYGFIGLVDFSQAQDGTDFVVENNFKFISEYGFVINVPKEFKTDLASIPELSRIGLLLIVLGHFLSHLHILGHIPFLIGAMMIWLSKYFRHYGRYTSGSIVHDFLYRTQPYAKAVADEIFLEAMGYTNTNKIQKYIIYYAVKYFGQATWEKNQKQYHLNGK